MNKKVEEFNNNLKDKKIAVIGAGVSNIPLFEYLSNYGAKVTLFDKKEYDELSNEIIEIIKKYSIELSLGNKYLDSLVGFDIIFRSPSCLPTNEYLVKEKERGAMITTEVEQVIKLAPCKIIGITGSKGKTTTTTITDLLLKGSGVKTYVGGNIGKPIFTILNDIKEDDVIVLELSSFQLMGMEVSPNISIITNISPDHLDIHASYEEYIGAKKNIFRYQKDDDIVVLNYDDAIVRDFCNDVNGKVKYFSDGNKINNCYILDGNYIKYISDGREDIILDVRKIKLRGRHNYLNICAALNATDEYVDKDKVYDILKDFVGVKHRLEYVREINGVKWYNDSASTTPDKSNAGIMAFDEDITLIAGGYDKNLDYDTLAEKIVDKVKILFLFGQTKDKIYNSVKKILKDKDKDISIYVMDTLEEVVVSAYHISKPGSVVLFSPASASFDMFDNAYQRGDVFKELVNNL